MMYDEFLTLSGADPAQVSPADYAESIEPVYMWHPVLDQVNDAKARLVALWKDGLLPDMLPRALAVLAANDEIHSVREDETRLAQRHALEKEDLQRRHAEAFNRLRELYGPHAIKLYRR